jgi:hypothetical protein
MTIIALFYAIFLLTSCVANAETDEHLCMRLSSTENGFWRCMEMKQVEAENFQDRWDRNTQIPNPLAYLPPQQREITCHRSYYTNTVRCW